MFTFYLMNFSFYSVNAEICNPRIYLIFESLSSHLVHAEEQTIDCIWHCVFWHTNFHKWGIMLISTRNLQKKQQNYNYRKRNALNFHFGNQKFDHFVWKWKKKFHSLKTKQIWTKEKLKYRYIFVNFITIRCISIFAAKL